MVFCLMFLAVQAIFSTVSSLSVPLFGQRTRTSQVQTIPTWSPRGFPLLAASANEEIQPNPGSENSKLIGSTDSRTFEKSAGQQKGSNLDSSNLLSPQQLESLRESIDILDVVESFALEQFVRVTPTRAKALCPFHDDHNPSMSIDRDRGLFKCFSCGTGGDVFRFVQKYSELKPGSEPLTFGQAINFVAQRFGDGTSPFPERKTYRNADPSKGIELENKKKRLHLANAAAADFFGKNLVSLHYAGLARAHLKSRSVSPATVRKFAIGFAPDAYFNQPRGQLRGEGSLVARLKELGFLPEEIVAAGLATVTKKKKRERVIVENTNSTKRNPESKVALDYSDLMDRFRGRLMVPIFDSMGKNVLGFGGRHLDCKIKGRETNLAFKPPKYLNSPDSLVFQKKNTLFGHHLASFLTPENFAKEEDDDDAMPPMHSNTNTDVVVVEGYFDAIALSQAGISGVVASMGAAISIEQLTHAARIATARQGKLIICLDSDEAGVKGVERLCAAHAFGKVCEQNLVEIRVAQLSCAMKDPADFIDASGGAGNAKSGALFQNEIIETAVEWSEWYTSRLVSQYNSSATNGMKGSFPDVCNSIAKFLSMFTNLVDRTRRAYAVAGPLSGVISDGKEENSGALRIQLESDLVDMAARIAARRESVSRRVEAVDGYTESGQQSNSALMSLEDDPSTSTGSSFSPRRSAHALASKPDGDQKDDRNTLANEGTARESTLRQVIDQEAPVFRKKSVNPQSSRGRAGERMKYTKKEAKPLIPHFSGFSFSKRDADWLGLQPGNGAKESWVLSLGSGVNDKSTMKSRGRQIERAVYFNSNDFNGNRSLTEAAMSAGYGYKKLPRNPSILELGVSSLIEHDSQKVVDEAETRLLRSLVCYPVSRSALMSSQAAFINDRHGVSLSTIAWSCPERKWLFECLLRIPGAEHLPTSLYKNGTRSEVRNFLSQSKSVPEAAFDDEFTSNKVSIPGTENTAAALPGWTPLNVTEWDMDDIEKSENTRGSRSAIEEHADAVPERRLEEQGLRQGSLEQFFVDTHDEFTDSNEGGISLEKRAELTVQEALSIMLRETAVKRLHERKSEWSQSVSALESQLTLVDVGEQTDVPRSEEGDSHVGSKLCVELQDRCAVLSKEVSELSKLAHEMSIAAKRMGARLLDHSTSEGSQITLSTAKAEEVLKMMDEFIDSLPEDADLPISSQDDEAFLFDEDIPDSELESSYGLRSSQMTWDSGREELDGDESTEDKMKPGLSSSIGDFHVANRQEETIVGEDILLEVDDLIDSLPADTFMPDSPGDDGTYVFGSDEWDSELDPRYGGWAVEEIKSYKDAAQVPPPFADESSSEKKTRTIEQEKVTSDHGESESRWVVPAHLGSDSDDPLLLELPDFDSDFNNVKSPSELLIEDNGVEDELEGPLNFTSVFQ